MRISILTTCLIYMLNSLNASEEITPYKFENLNDIKTYKIPESSRFTVKRQTQNASTIVCYLSTSSSSQYPIAILCTGSSTKEDLYSVIHVHRFFLKDFQDLGVGVLTLEQEGIDGEKVDEQKFMDHYTRSTRLQDHQTVIDYLKNNPPKGWNGKFIYLGISEGGVIINSLTEKNTDTTIATMNFSGVGHWSWRDELWVFIQRMKKDIPWHIKLRVLIPQCLPFSIRLDLPSTRKEYDNTMDEISKSPSPNTEFMGMSYQYHADAMLYPPAHYEKLKTPILVVSGAQDTIINSSDEFVENAKKANVPITYFRIHDMDHYIRHRPDIINESFEWLKTILIQNDH